MVVQNWHKTSGWSASGGRRGAVKQDEWRRNTFAGAGWGGGGSADPLSDGMTFCQMAWSPECRPTFQRGECGSGRSSQDLIFPAQRTFWKSFWRKCWPAWPLIPPSEPSALWGSQQSWGDGSAQSSSGSEDGSTHVLGGAGGPYTVWWLQIIGLCPGDLTLFHCLETIPKAKLRLVSWSFCQ